MPIAAAATNSLKITEKKARGGQNKVDWFQLEIFNEIKISESEKARQGDMFTLFLVSSLPIIDYTVFILWNLLDVLNSFKQL